MQEGAEDAVVKLLTNQKQEDVQEPEDAHQSDYKVCTFSFVFFRFNIFPSYKLLALIEYVVEYGKFVVVHFTCAFGHNK